MIKYISILRGINVGGHRKILMVDLKRLYVKLNLINPTTYIQSGNVVFESDESNIEDVESKITGAIRKEFGFEVPVLVRLVEEFSEAVSLSPFYNIDVDIKSLYFTFLSKTPSKKEIQDLESVNSGEDNFKIIGRTVHALIQPPYHKSKLSNQIIEKKLKCSATTRNWKTVNKLIDLAN